MLRALPCLVLQLGLPDVFIEHGDPKASPGGDGMPMASQAIAKRFFQRQRADCPLRTFIRRQLATRSAFATVALQGLLKSCIAALICTRHLHPTL